MYTTEPPWRRLRTRRAVVFSRGWSDPNIQLWSAWMRFVIRTLTTAAALWVATALLGGITVTGSSGWSKALTLTAVAVIFGIVNAILKPIIQVLGCLFYVVTLGLIAFVVNALLLLLVSAMAGALDLPFHVDGFWTALVGSIIISIVGWALNLVLPDRPRPAEVIR